MIGMNLAGAFAEQLSVPTKCLIGVPNSLVDRGAALAEPAATVIHALRLTQRALNRPLVEQRVLVIGAGAIGLLALLRFQHLGCQFLAVVESNPLRAAGQTHATGIGVTELSRIEDNSADFVFDAVGVAATRDLALRAVAPGGIVTHVGLGDWSSGLDWRKLTLAEITLIGCYTYTSADLHATVAALTAGQFGDLAWVEERPLSDGAAAFDDLNAGRTRSAKILLRPHP